MYFARLPMVCYEGWATMLRHPRFRDRLQTGSLLAQRLRPDAGRKNALVLTLPSDGVPVAYALARQVSRPERPSSKEPFPAE